MTAFDKHVLSRRVVAMLTDGVAQSDDRNDVFLDYFDDNNVNNAAKCTDDEDGWDDSDNEGLINEPVLTDDTVCEGKQISLSLFLSLSLSLSFSENVLK